MKANGFMSLGVNLNVELDWKIHMRKLLRLSAAYVMLTAVAPVVAQTVSWHVPVFAEMPREAAWGPSKIHPYWVLANLPLRVMQFSSMGSPGLVLAGGAEFTEDDGWNAPVTPYLTKISSTDGSKLWSWQPNLMRPQQGRIWSMAEDVVGHIVVAGSNHQPQESSARYLVAKFDAVDGHPIWLVNGPLHTGGRGMAVDSVGNVLLTSTSPGGESQVVSKFRGETGALIWSVEMPAGRSDLDDFRLAVDAKGDVIAGGYFCDCADPAATTMGTQIGKFDGVNGTLLWIRRSSIPTFGAALRSLVASPTGDVIVHGGVDEFARLSAIDGTLIWARRRDDMILSDMLLDGNGRLFGVGLDPRDSGSAVVERFDATSGATLWRSSLQGEGASSATALAVDADTLFVGWQISSDMRNLGTSKLNAKTGKIEWSAHFGSTAPTSSGGIPLSIVISPKDGVFVGARASADGNGQTWMVYAFGDTIFTDGYEFP